MQSYPSFQSPVFSAYCSDNLVNNNTISVASPSAATLWRDGARRYGLLLIAEIDLSVNISQTASDVPFHLDFIFLTSGLDSNSSGLGIPNVSRLTSR